MCAMPVMMVLMHVHVVVGVAVAMMVDFMQVTKLVCVVKRKVIAYRRSCGSYRRH